MQHTEQKKSCDLILFHIHFDINVKMPWRFALHYVRCVCVLWNLSVGRAKVCLHAIAIDQKWWAWRYDKSSATHITFVDDNNNDSDRTLRKIITDEKKKFVDYSSVYKQRLCSPSISEPSNAIRFNNEFRRLQTAFSSDDGANRYEKQFYLLYELLNESTIQPNIKASKHLSAHLYIEGAAQLLCHIAVTLDSVRISNKYN